MVFVFWGSTMRGSICGFWSGKIRKSEMSRQEVAFREKARKIKGFGSLR